MTLSSGGYSRAVVKAIIAGLILTALASMFISHMAAKTIERVAWRMDVFENEIMSLRQEIRQLRAQVRAGIEGE